MKRLSIVAALVAIVVAVPLSIGSSHREAPLTSIDPTADDTDVYAYTAKDAPGLADGRRQLGAVRGPGRRPELLQVRPDARGYYINVDNTGDGKYDVRYRFKFRDKYENGGSSFLYALPGVSSIDDPKLLQKQFYDVERLSYGYAKSASASKRGKKHSRKAQSKPKAKHRSKRARAAQRAHGRPQHPGRAEQRRAEDDPGLRRRSPTRRSRSCPAAARCSPASVTTRSSWTSACHVRRDQPRGAGAAGSGKDDLAGYGVHSIVLQVPEEQVTRDGEEVDSAQATATRSSACGPRPSAGASRCWPRTTTMTATTTCRSPASGTRS